MTETHRSATTYFYLYIESSTTDLHTTTVDIRKKGSWVYVATECCMQSSWTSDCSPKHTYKVSTSMSVSYTIAFSLCLFLCRKADGLERIGGESERSVPWFSSDNRVTSYALKESRGQASSGFVLNWLASVSLYIPCRAPSVWTKPMVLFHGVIIHPFALIKESFLSLRD